ncbi:MAG: metallophosphoesterase [Desulfobacterales bacterium]|jgi:3',5'-cyclic AMP phosphodiesterase CpdA|nr:metallophosphoesterase [Desulfobacterales bacterium]
MMKFVLTQTWIGALLLGLAVFPPLGVRASPPGAEAQIRFYFVQITDTHFGERDHLERTRKLVEQINRLPYEIACVVHTGDIFADNIADAGVREAGLGVLRSLKAPLHLLPGNHDILQKDLERTAAVYSRSVGPLLHTVEYHGVVFILAYTEPLALGFGLDGYEPLRELEAALVRSAGKPAILFHHRPAVDDYYEFASSPGWSGPARAALEKLLTAHDVKAVITGHFHRDELHWAGSRPVFAAPPVAGYWGRQAGFRLYEYHNGRLGYRTIYLPE